MEAEFVIRSSRVGTLFMLSLGAAFLVSGVTAVIVAGDPLNLLWCTPVLPLGLYGVHRFASRIEVHPWGFIKRSPFSSKSIRWIDISTVHHRPARPMRMIGGIASAPPGLLGGAEQLSIRTWDGHHIKFEQTVSRSRLVDRIKGGTLHHLLPLYRDQLNVGKSVRLGPVTISRNAGLEIKMIKRTIIGFDELEPHRLKRGNLGLKRTDARTTTWVPAEKVPNLHVLLALLDEFTYRAAEAS